MIKNIAFALALTAFSSYASFGLADSGSQKENTTAE